MLTAADDARVAAAIRDAESRTDGEVAVIVTDMSDPYRDVVLHWALIAALLPPALATAFPSPLEHMAAWIEGGWQAPSLRLMLTLALVAAVLAFLIARLVCGLTPIRLALTPAATKARRVRRRALLLFRAGTERRTATRTGVLLYVSLAERRAEIVADSGIHARVPDDRWGEAMAGLLDGIAAGLPGDGMTVAIGRIGAVLAEHFPHTGTDPNELPDRLIRL